MDSPLFFSGEQGVEEEGYYYYLPILNRLYTDINTYLYDAKITKLCVS